MQQNNTKLNSKESRLTSKIGNTCYWTGKLMTGVIEFRRCLLEWSVIWQMAAITQSKQTLQKQSTDDVTGRIVDSIVCVSKTKPFRKQLYMILPSSNHLRTHLLQFLRWFRKHFVYIKGWDTILKIAMTKKQIPF